MQRGVEKVASVRRENGGPSKTLARRLHSPVKRADQQSLTHVPHFWTRFSTSSPNSHLVHSLQQQVRQVQQDWNRRTAYELLGWLVAAGLAMGIAVGVVDWVLRPVDRGLRVLLSVTLAAALVALVLRLVRWWHREKWSEMSAAQALQSAFPQLGDRLASSLEFLRQEEDDAAAGSAAMRRAVVAESASELETIASGKVARRPGLRWSAIAAMALIALLLSLTVLSPSVARTAISRLIAPWNNVEWPRRNNLTFVQSPELLAAGDAFEVSLIDSSGPLPQDVAIEYRSLEADRDRVESSWMQRVGDTMVARRENVRDSFEFRATGGDHRTMNWAKVEVVERPSVAEVQLMVHPPSYTGLPTAEATPNTRIQVGSTVSLNATASQSLVAAKLQWSDTKADQVDVPIRNATSLELPAGTWIIASRESGQRLRSKLVVKSTTGLQGEAALQPLQVVVDAPPQIEWRSPSSDWSVLAGAMLPIELSAGDDLALAKVGFVAEQLSSSTDPSDAIEPLEITLYQGPSEPPERDRLPSSGDLLDRHVVEQTLDLEPLDLSPGDILQLTAAASDYLPQESTVATPRRITIITRAEFDSQLAATQAALLRLLEQALADQRSAKASVSQLAGSVLSGQHALDELLATRLTQQAVRRTLTQPLTGALSLARELTQRLAINRMQEPKLLAQLEGAAKVIEGLSEGSLPEIENALTNLRKQLDVQAGQPARDKLAADFSNLSNEQQQVIVSLEQLIDQMAAWSDADRFVRELVRLEQDQRGLRDQSLNALRRNIQSRTDRQADPVEPAELQQLAEAQADVARRFDKLMQAMRSMVESDAASNEFKDRMADALREAESQTLSVQLAGAAQEVADNQLGRGAESQQRAADGLAELVNRLRDRTPTDASELASRLRALQERLAELKRQTQQAASQLDPSKQAESQSELQRKLDEAARELSRLTASEASGSIQRAAASASPKPNQSQEQRKDGLKQAEQDIQQAERELAERIAELENQEQQRLLDRLADVLDDLIPRQQSNLEQTLQLQGQHEAQASLNVQQKKQTTKLAELEVELAKQLEEAIADVESRSVFQLALGGAAGDMRQAAGSLQRFETGRITQDLQLNALSRMRHVLDILRDPPPAPPEGESPPAGGGGNQPQPPPLIELAEVKMLRWLQHDLNTRTRLYEANAADNAIQADEKRAAAERLADEQRKLEQLVREMLHRNNGSVQRPIDL